MKESKPIFKDVYYQPGEQPVFCYRTGLTVYEETYTKGGLVSSGWNAAGYPLNVLTGYPSRLDVGRFWEPFAFDIVADGAALNRDTEFKSFESHECGGTIRSELTLDCPSRGAEIKISTILDGTEVFERFLTITNNSNKPMAISKIAVMAGGIETMGGLSEKAPFGRDINKLYSLGYFDRTDSNTEGDFSWHDLLPDGSCIDTRFNRGRHRHPMFMLRNNVMGTILTAQLGWSAGCRFSFDLNTAVESNGTALSFKAEITGYKPLIILEPGESWVSPSMHIGMIAGGFDDAVNAMNAHLRRSVLNLPEAAEPQMFVGGGMGPEHDMSVETTKQFIEQLARMGAEIFIVDAGWYNKPGEQGRWGETGDWHYDPDRYPNGLAEIRDYAHALGMKFGLWMEPERIGLPSASEKYSGWLSRRADGSLSGLLDMTNPEAAAWAEEQVARCITEYKMDLLRIDYNISSAEYFHVKRKHGMMEDQSIRHFDAVYEMYKRLKLRFPDVVFENCASGGARTDVGILRYFSHTWVSDNQVAPVSLMITNGMTAALPPERVDRLVSGMGCHTAADLAFHFRNAMLGHLSLNVLGPRTAVMNDAAFEFAAHEVAIYKNFIRKILPDCLIFHHTEDNSAFKRGEPVIIEEAAPDGSRGVIAVFTPCLSKQDNVVVIPRGIDPSKTYKVYFDNSRSSAIYEGSSLIRDGLKTYIPSSLSSELILYEDAATAEN